MSQRTDDEPEEVITALREWLATQSYIGSSDEHVAAVRYWLDGDEVEDAAPMQVIDSALAEESYIFTFGMGSEHKRCYVQIAGDTNLSRERMVATFKLDWARQYRTLEEATRGGKYELKDITAEHIPEEWRVPQVTQIIRTTRTVTIVTDVEYDIVNSYPDMTVQQALDYEKNNVDLAEMYSAGLFERMPHNSVTLFDVKTEVVEK